MLQKGNSNLFSFTIFILILSNLTFGQTLNCTCFVKGKIIDRQSGEVVVGALVEISAQKKEEPKDIGFESQKPASQSAKLITKKSNKVSINVYKNEENG